METRITLTSAYTGNDNHFMILRNSTFFLPYHTRKCVCARKKCFPSRLCEQHIRVCCVTRDLTCMGLIEDAWRTSWNSPRLRFATLIQVANSHESWQPN